jgi:hypothetical protein
MNETDINNLGIISKLVEKHFSLEESSLETFKKNLYERDIDPIYKNLLGENLRFYAPFDINIVENLDESWRIFQNFTLFVDAVKPTFEQYAKNKFLYEKNEYKLSKMLGIIYDGRTPELIREIENISSMYYLSSYDALNAIKRDIEFGVLDRNKLANYFLDKRLKLSGEKINIVLSLNFADWFLCSTGESWSSCLSLESCYQECYWSGLPGFIADKNRCMIYITNGEKKNYQGIITDKFLHRGWGILGKNNELFIPVMYPTKRICGEKIAPIFGFSGLLDEINSFRSKYPINFLRYETGDSCFGYNDFSKISAEGENFYIKGSTNGGFFSVDKYNNLSSHNVFNYEEGLTYLVDKNETIQNFTGSRICCSNCGNRVDEEDYYTAPEGEPLCEDCYHETVCTCEICSREMYADQAYSNNNDELICQRCLDRYYITCEDCGELEHNDDSMEYISFSGNELAMCRYCFESRLSSGTLAKCTECGLYYEINAEEDNPDSYVCGDCCFKKAGKVG